MKKLKILPTVLMLVLCVGVLAIGIYAITPSKNTIDGTITINASNSPVSIELFIDGESQGPAQTVRSIKEWKVGELKFNTDTVNTLDEVKDRTVTLKVSNLSDKALGVYFFNPDSTLDMTSVEKTDENGDTVTDEDGNVVYSFVGGTAKINNVMLERPVYYDGATVTDETTKIATAYFTPYYYLGKQDANNTFDTVEMNITFEAYQFFTSSKSYEFDWRLNVEPYYGNVKSEDFVTGGPEFDYDIWEVVYDNIRTSSVTEQLIKIDDTVTTIPSYAFNGNTTTGDHMVVIPSSVITQELTVLNYDMGYYYMDPFRGLSDLKAVSINASYTFNATLSNDYEISDKEFFGDSNLGVLAINGDIVDYMFCKTNMTRVELSSNVQSIGEYAFTCDNNIRTDGIKKVKGFINGDTFSYKDGVLTVTSELTKSSVVEWENIELLILSFEFDNSVEASNVTMPLYSFKGCSNLTSVSIPNGVDFGNAFFGACYHLETINYKEENENYEFNNGTLTIKTNLESANIPKYIKGLTLTLLWDADSLDTTIKTGLIGNNSINGESLYRCLKHVIISPKIKTLEKVALNGCRSLQNVIIPSSVTSIGDSAFQDCYSLREIYIPASVLTIGYGIVRNCSSDLIIKCGASSKPEGWKTNWNDSSYSSKYPDSQILWGVAQPE